MADKISVKDILITAFVLLFIFKGCGALKNYESPYSKNSPKHRTSYKETKNLTPQQRIFQQFEGKRK